MSMIIISLVVVLVIQNCEVEKLIIINVRSIFFPYMA